MRLLPLVLVGCALFWVAPACSGSDDTSPVGGGGGGASGGVGGSGGSEEAAVCVSNVDAVMKTLADYLASQPPCTLDAHCAVVNSFHIQECQGWCTLAVRADAVDGLEQIASLPCTTCKANPHWYPDCVDAGTPSAVCKAGKCEVSYPAQETDAGDATADAETPDASAD